MAIGPSGSTTVALELYAAATASSRWDQAIWDGDRWQTAAWQAIECQVVEADWQTLCSSEAGILSTPDAGALDLRTYDPDRILDPLNNASPLWGAIRVGTPIRLVAETPASMPVWSGFVDEGRFELASSTGRIRAVDAIATLAQTDVPEGTALPNTLRARVRAVVNACGLATLIPVEPERYAGPALLNGNFETGDPSPWAGAGLSVHSSSGEPWWGGFGSWFAGLIAAGAGWNEATQIVGGIIAGQTYVMSAYVGNAPGYLYVEWQSIDGAVLGNTNYAFPAFPTPIAFASFTTAAAPAGTERARILMANTSTTNELLFDEVVFTASNQSAYYAVDPPVAAFDGKAASAWKVIQDAALDALTLVYVDATGTLRFMSWGSIPDGSFGLGCPPADAGGATWIEGLATLEATQQADGIRNSVRSWASANTFGSSVTDPASIRRYGERRVDVPRIVPNASTWSSRILADRADAGLQVTLGEVRPYTLDELAQLLQAGLDGPSTVDVHDDEHGTPVDLALALIGTRAGVTENGWRFRFVTMLPRASWDALPPVIPPVTPPGGTYHQETRTYIASSDALVALTSGGSNYGAGAASTIPVGSWQGWQYRGLVQFPAIPTTKLRDLVSATLQLQTTTQVRVGFGSSPTVDVKRITGSWSAGSSSTPSSGNAVVWPGPAVTGSVRADVSRSSNAAVAIRVDELVRAWLPSSAGGSLAAQRGLALYAGSGSTVDTSEVWPVEKGSTARPTLVLVLNVFD